VLKFGGCFTQRWSVHHFTILCKVKPFRYEAPTRISGWATSSRTNVRSAGDSLDGLRLRLTALALVHRRLEGEQPIELGVVEGEDQFVHEVDLHRLGRRSYPAEATLAGRTSAECDEQLGVPVGLADESQEADGGVLGDHVITAIDDALVVATEVVEGGVHRGLLEQLREQDLAIDVLLFVVVGQGDECGGQ